MKLGCGVQCIPRLEIWLRSETRGRNPTLKGNKVRFHLEDVFIPSAEDVKAFFGEAEELEGTVIDFSDSGSRPNAFAIVEVVQKQKFVIPVEKLRTTGDTDVA